MKPITFARAAAWLGVAAIGWSLVNLRWGDDPHLPVGPPATVERNVVGALLVGAIAAVALSAGARSWWGKGIAVAGAAGAVAIGLYIRSKAAPTALSGRGWMIMMVGCGLLAAAACAVAALRRPVADSASRRTRERKRAKVR